MPKGTREAVLRRRLLRRLFASQDVDVVRAAFSATFGEAALAEIADSLDGALRGDQLSTRAYVFAFRSLADSVLTAATEQAGTEVSVRSEPSTQFVIVRGLLVDSSVEVPVSPWAASYGTADGIALHVMWQVRLYLPGAVPLTAPPQKELVADFDELQYFRFARSVRRCVYALDAPSALEEVMRAFALDKTAAGELFGVSRQAISRWLTEDRVPADRQSKLAAMSSVADLLERKLKPGRLPGIARREAEAYGGLTMLEMIKRDRHEELLRLVRESFSWDRAA